MPSERALRRLNRLHRLLLAATRGRLGWRADGMPVLEVTTIGRRTGRPHTVMLTSPTQLGDAYVLVASRFGDERNPAWFLNLRANPEVTVKTKRRTLQMRARVATPNERAELWPTVAGRWYYARYQRRTSRDIPLVLLEPVDCRG